MLKLVISNENSFLRWMRIPLLNRCFVFDYSRLNEIQNEEVYEKVFSQIIVTNGLTKTTKRGRFGDLDRIFVELMRPPQPATIHDIGVSSGITSLELFQAVEKTNNPFTFYISDKFAKIYFSGNRIRKFFDAEGKLISVNYYFLHLAPRIGRVFFLSRWLFKLFDSENKGKVEDLKEVLLLDRNVYQKIHESRIGFIEFDVFHSKVAKPFNFLRCMNVLMPAYFSRARILAGVDNLKQNLEEGGYLLIGRTDENDINHATLYQKRDGQLETARVVNRGFESLPAVEAELHS